MARLYAALVGVCVAAVCVAVVVDEDVIPGAEFPRIVNSRKSVDIVDHPEQSNHHSEHHRRYIRHQRYEAEQLRRFPDDESVDEVPFHHRSDHHYHHRRHYHHHRHHYGHHRGRHSFEEVIVRFVRTEGAKSGLNSSDVNKLVDIVRRQIRANREDLYQDRSNWTQLHFYEQYQRMEQRMHGGLQILANQAIEDHVHLAVFFQVAEAKQRELKLEMFEDQKRHLQRFARTANVSQAHFEHFMSVVQANPIEVIPRRHMSVKERSNLLKAVNVDWIYIKHLSMLDMNREDKEKMQTFFDLVQQDYLRHLQQRHHHGHHGHHGYYHHHHHHHHKNNDESDDESTIRRHHRNHRRHQHSYDERDDEPDVHHHRRHSDHDDGGDHRLHGDMDDETREVEHNAQQERSRRHRHLRLRDRLHKSERENSDDRNDEDNEIVPRRRPTQERMRSRSTNRASGRTPISDKD